MLITENRLGAIKELNGVNCAPYNKRAGDDQAKIFNFFKYFYFSEFSIGLKSWVQVTIFPG